MTITFPLFHFSTFSLYTFVMNETCQQAETFLTEILADMRFDLRVSSQWTDEGCLLDLSGEDVPLLLAENGEMLDAFETLLFQIYGRQLDREHRFTCDADGFRRTRRAELQAMARFAAGNVRKSSRPFTSGPEFDRAPHYHLTSKRSDNYGIGRRRS